MASETIGIKQTGIKLFRISRIQIRLDYSWLIIFLLVLWSLSAGYFPRYYPDQTLGIYWLSGLIATLLFFASILTHEISHCLVARQFGIEIHEITLFIFGGMANIAQEPQSPKAEFMIAIIGPLTSFILAAVFWAMNFAGAAALPILPSAVLEYLAFINLALGIFNLLPGFPLDGGRVFRALWWWKTGSLKRATRVASNIGKGLAITLMVLGALQIFAGVLIGGVWLMFIGMFLRGMAEGGYRQLVVQQSLETVQAKQIMINEMVSVPATTSIEGVINDYFLRYGFRGFPVARDGEILGVISLPQVKTIPAQDRAKNNASQAMIPRSPKIEIAAEASLAKALQQMTQEDVGRLLVIDKNQIVGMITKTGLLRYWQAKQTLENPTMAH